eukprot:scaffold32085_cov49-Cyclotella_meneghiniana.AAC.1
MGRWMVLGIVIPPVCCAGPPIKSELFLICPVSQPVETDIHGFCAFGLDTVVDDAFGRGVVCLNRGGRLLVAHLF